jgi:hypothetical protein
MNIPYVKQFDKNGTLLNPIKGSYLNEFPNRSERHKKKERFHGESKNFHLTVVKSALFKRVRQIEFEKDGTRKTIEHYLPC